MPAVEEIEFVESVVCRLKANVLLKVYGQTKNNMVVMSQLCGNQINVVKCNSAYIEVFSKIDGLFARVFHQCKWKIELSCLYQPITVASVAAQTNKRHWLFIQTLPKSFKQCLVPSKRRIL